MSIIVELTDQEIADIRQLTNTTSAAEAVSQAAREYLRLRRLQELKLASGNVDYDDNWQELEKLELGETGFPQ